jgi:hypothetical protein
MLKILHAGLERNKKDFDQKIYIFQLQIIKNGWSSPLFVSLFSLPLKTENTNFRRGVKNDILERTLVF